jgi:uncharacterized short protein YbdD (DUF466 family)
MIRKYAGWLCRGLRTIMRAWNGDDAYRRYVEDCAARAQPPLPRGRYFAERLERRYSGVARCC